jgi:rare lipoprotein A
MLHAGAAPRVLWLFVAGVLLNACAETNLAMHAVKSIGREASAPPKPQYKVGQPYQVDGVWYYPAEDLRYSAKGVASWYGDDFQGRPTANGEVFDKMALTAAHTTLPMPSQVRVTNLRNGKTLDLRVNDRGPFVGSRVIDVSQRAAQLLGFEQDGTAPVRVEILPEESQRLKQIALGPRKPGADEFALKPLPVAPVQTALAPTQVAIRVLPQPASPPLTQQVAAPVAPPAPVRAASPATAAAKPTAPTTKVAGMYVQAGSFLSYENAAALRRRLSPIGETAISPSEDGERTWYLVRIGPVANKYDAEYVKRQVAQAGIADARLVSVAR